jgi:hypothetical protein
MINPLLWWDLRLLTAPKVRPLKTNSGHRRDIVGVIPKSGGLVTIGISQATVPSFN